LPAAIVVHRRYQPETPALNQRVEALYSLIAEGADPVVLPAASPSLEPADSTCFSGQPRVRNVSYGRRLYLSVSTDDERRERQSIVTERDFPNRYCDLHQLPVYAEYADDSVTGTVPLEKRPAGIRLLEDARRHKFDQILVFKLDPRERTAPAIRRAA
jgi:hypothetical protein